MISNPSCNGAQTPSITTRGAFTKIRYPMPAAIAADPKLLKEVRKCMKRPLKREGCFYRYVEFTKSDPRAIKIKVANEQSAKTHEQANRVWLSLQVLLDTLQVPVGTAVRQLSMQHATVSALLKLTDHGALSLDECKLLAAVAGNLLAADALDSAVKVLQHIPEDLRHSVMQRAFASYEAIAATQKASATPEVAALRKMLWAAQYAQYRDQCPVDDIVLQNKAIAEAELLDNACQKLGVPPLNPQQKAKLDAWRAQKAQQVHLAQQAQNPVPTPAPQSDVDQSGDNARSEASTQTERS